MNFFSESLTLKDTTFTLLRDAIHETLGMYFETDRRDILADKLSPLVIERGFDSFLDYYYLLKYDSKAEEEWLRVMEALSVQETYFFREMDQIRALATTIVPSLLSENRALPITIWSAACATGEEPLTIAITLREAGLLDQRIRILASDASQSAIDKAKAGIYRERSLRNTSAEMRSRYFSQTPKGWQIDPTLHQRIEWHRINLMDARQVVPLARTHLLFCRNVFIYFSPDSIRKTVDMFFDNMRIPGYLFVAAAESLLKITTAFKLREIGGAFVYVKEP